MGYAERAVRKVSARPNWGVATWLGATRRTATAARDAAESGSNGRALTGLGDSALRRDAVFTAANEKATRGVSRGVSTGVSSLQTWSPRSAGSISEDDAPAMREL
jgi:hypothetical protein